MDGRYDLRALARDTAGNETFSAVQTNKVIDNDTTPTGTDIQVVNGGATAGLAEPNDVITLAYSEPLNPATITAGFTGTSTAIRVRLTNSGAGDRMEFRTSTGGTQFYLTTGLSLGGTNYVSNTVEFNATMVQDANRIVITLGTVRSGATRLRTQTTNTTMAWTPSATARDWANHAVGTTPVNEAPPADVEF